MAGLALMGSSVQSGRGEPKSRKRAGLDAVAGALSGAVSRFVVGPLDVVKIRMQVQIEPVRKGGAAKYTGVQQALRCILREEGIAVRIALVLTQAAGLSCQHELRGALCTKLLPALKRPSCYASTALAHRAMSVKLKGTRATWRMRLCTSSTCMCSWRAATWCTLPKSVTVKLSGAGSHGRH